MSPAELQQNLQDIADRLAEAFSLPSSAAALTVHGETVYAFTGEASEESVFPIASMTKSFLAAALCAAQDEGKLSLDDPVRKYLPDFRLHDERAGQELTIRDALCHRSGLPAHALVQFCAGDMSLDELAERLAFLEPSAGFRELYQYQNLMYGLCTRVLELAVSESYADYVESRILRPLNLEHTRVVLRDSELIQAYARIRNRICPIPPYPVHNAGMCTDMSATVSDLAAWTEALRTCRVGEISPELLREMRTPQIEIPRESSPYYLFPEIGPRSYGLGLMQMDYRGLPLVHHGGDTGGFSGVMGFSETEEFSFVYCTAMSDSLAPKAMMFQIADLLTEQPPLDWTARYEMLYRVLFEKTEEQLEGLRSLVQPEPPEGWQTVCGEYGNAGYGRLCIVNLGGLPFLVIGPYRIPLLFAGRCWFADASDLYRMMFPVVFDDAGNCMIRTEPALESFTVFNRREPE